MTFAFNTLFAAVVIAFVSWLSGRSPTIAGLIAAMPLSSMLILPMSQLQHGSTENTTELARSILFAVPVACLFFLPFLFAERLGLSFWRLYGVGMGLTFVGAVAYRWLTR